MKITQAGEYGLLALIHMAKQPEGRLVMIDAISKAEDIPKGFLAKILQNLSRAGLIRTRQGARGGVSLARQPQAISVLEIIEAIEGKIAFQRCLEESPGCEKAESCTLCAVFTEAQNRMTDVFRNMKLVDLMQPMEAVIAKVRSMPLGSSSTTATTAPAVAPVPSEDLHLCSAATAGANGEAGSSRGCHCHSLSAAGVVSSGCHSLHITT
ncbi:MAG: Rrf2 family transcriptional regulator [Candidatus Methylacidiphilales bacterium]|nr:Rrf2 family transcriptional regulator [Candidatus Methylacidiphilales bacterium]